ncbi:D-2-hydroxyacid dehydrogenase [Lentibacillus saliphilus]|uniref:D-2-hydroxyacid dehydrogenase n=1 Tax=Lentibacillus saliphilus TaxID=2737028 RepID=UPI001C310139|nr:D-2-hydroxyacid dehydrogenase [Lentibacillus saliphilus]
MNIVFTARISKKHRDHLEANNQGVTFFFCNGISEAERYLPTADVLVTYGEDLTESDIDKAVKLRWIMVISAGLERMPLHAIQKRDILVTNARGIHKVPMAEYVISMLLQVYRQEKQLIHNERNHIWDKSLRMQEISGRTMLIVGTGAIGQEVARLAKAFHMTTIGVSKSGRPVASFDETHKTIDLKDQLPKADFVVSVLPSTPDTRQLFSIDHFNAMPNHAIFINIGRGDVVAEDIIVEAIRSQKIAHVVLDVFEEEPLPANHMFWKEENITVTPHISGVSAQYVTRALAIFEENLHVFKHNGTSFMNKIDVQRGY